MPTSSTRRRPRMEDALALDIRTLSERGLLAPGRNQGTMTCTVRGHTFTESLQVAIDGDRGLMTISALVPDAAAQSAPQAIRLVTSCPPLGGRRWWFVCPLSGRRAWKLYKLAGEEVFCHRLALTPAPSYRSQRVSALDRTMARRAALHGKISDRGALTGKPAGMRWRTYLRMKARYRELEEREGRLLISRVFPEMNRK